MLYKLAERDLDRLNEVIKEDFIKLTDGKEKLIQQESKKENMKKKVFMNDSALQKAEAWLKTHGPNDSIMINGVNYTYNDIFKDAQARVRENEVLIAGVNTFEQAMASLRSKITGADQAIRSGLNAIRAKKDDIEQRKSLDAIFSAVKNAMSITSNLEFSTYGSTDEVVSKYVNELDRRLARKKADLAFEDFQGSHSGAVPWENGDVASSRNSLDFLEQYKQKYWKNDITTQPDQPANQTKAPVVVPQTNNPVMIPDPVLPDTIVPDDAPKDNVSFLFMS